MHLAPFLSLSVVSLAASLLAGCAQPPLERDTAPPSGPTARLLMRSALQPGDHYGVFLADSANDCQGMRKAATGSQQQGDPAAIAISAEGVRTLEVFLTKRDRSTCRVRLSFTPKAGRSYLVSTQHTADACSALVYDATDVEAIRLEPSLLRRDDPANLCLPLAQSRSLALLATQPDGSMRPTASAMAPRRSTRVVDDDLKALIGGRP